LKWPLSPQKPSAPSKTSRASNYLKDRRSSRLPRVSVSARVSARLFVRCALPPLSRSHSST
jgi:hypothetical protein